MNASQGRSIMVQGRIVWCSGDLFKGKVKTEYGTQIPKLGRNGEQQMEYGFGLAVPKSVLGQLQPGQTEEIWGAIHNEAYTFFPTRQIPPAFAMKYKDGDTAVDKQGAPYSQREGYAGHLVFACTTSLPIKFFKYENGQNIMINEGIKCGDYVNVQLTIKAHAAIGAGNAGLYLNPNAVQFLGYGKEIVNAPSGDQIFGNALPPMPVGASATPIAPLGMLVPTAPVPAPAPLAPPQAAGMPVPAPAAVPHFAVLPPQFQPPAGGLPAAGGPPPIPR